MFGTSHWQRCHRLLHFVGALGSGVWELQHNSLSKSQEADALCAFKQQLQPQPPESFLMQCLRARDFKTETAAAVLRNFCEFRAAQKT